MDHRLREASFAGAAIAVALGIVLFAAPVLIGADDPGRYLVLDNGLRVFLLEKRDLPLLHIVTGFDVGSKTETDATSGTVHLLEHCILFRGTAGRTGEEVGADIRRHGAYFNAHTGQDLSIFEISLPSAEAQFALRNQRDILFGFEVTQAEIFLTIIIIIFIALLTRTAARIVDRMMVNYIPTVVKKVQMEMDETMQLMIRRLVSATIYVIGLMFIILQIPQLHSLATAILAGAGIAGLAIGYAAQGLTLQLHLQHLHCRLPALAGGRFGGLSGGIRP